MKSSEEICPLGEMVITVAGIKAIQQDARQSAFKEAAEICERAKVVQKYYPQDRVHNGTCGELSKAILAHAEKEKSK